MTYPATHSGPVRRGRGREGFTLAEVAVSVGILSILAVAIGSAVVLAGKAVPDPRSPAQSALRAAQQVEQIASELRYALSVGPHDLRNVEFTVPDRNADQVPETIRYGWSGAAGDPLVRSYNGAQTTVLSNVHRFELTYHLAATTTETPVGNESGETLLISNTATLYLDDLAIKNDRYAGQYFRPSLPADTVSWKVTRIRFQAKVSGLNTGLTKVQLYRASAGGLPIGSVLQEHSMYESYLSLSYLWEEFFFSKATGLLPTEGLCLVLRHVSGNESCSVYYQKSGASNPNTCLLLSTNQGVSWSAATSQSLRFYVYGKVTTSGTPTVQTTYYVPRITLTAQVGTEPASAIRTAVFLVNRPEAVGP